MKSRTINHVAQILNRRAEKLTLVLPDLQSKIHKEEVLVNLGPHASASMPGSNLFY